MPYPPPTTSVRVATMRSYSGPLQTYVRIFSRSATIALVLAPITLFSVQSAAQAASDNPAGCAMHVDDPHPSTHAPGRINAIVRFSCRTPVTMGVAGGLWRHRWYGWQKMAATSQTFTHATSGSLSVNVTCPSGSYTWYANGSSNYRQGDTIWTSYGPSSAQKRFTCSGLANVQPSPPASPPTPELDAPVPLPPASPIPPPSASPTSPSAPPPQTWSETTGGVTHTWTNYSNAGGYEGLGIPSNQTVQIACKLPGFAVADGNTWWYRIASDPWSSAYYASADAFYNNGQTSGSLLGTPFVDPSVQNC
jgi:hypothetical protein